MGELKLLTYAGHAASGKKYGLLRSMLGSHLDRVTKTSLFRRRVRNPLRRIGKYLRVESRATSADASLGRLGEHQKHRYEAMLKHQLDTEPLPRGPQRQAQIRNIVQGLGVKARTRAHSLRGREHRLRMIRSSAHDAALEAKLRGATYGTAAAVVGVAGYRKHARKRRLRAAKRSVIQ